MGPDWTFLTFRTGGRWLSGAFTVRGAEVYVRSKHGEKHTWFRQNPESIVRMLLLELEADATHKLGTSS
jgi:hypothetical protein